MKPTASYLLSFCLAGLISAQGQTVPTSSPAPADINAPKSVDIQLPPIQNGTVNSQLNYQKLDPFATGAFWQENYLTTYQRPLIPGSAITTFSLQNSTMATPSFGTGLDTLTRQNSASLNLSPINAVSVTSTAKIIQDPLTAETTGTGAGLEADAKLPLQSQLKLQANLDQQNSELAGTDASRNQNLGAEIRQPIAKLPITLVLGGNYTETVDPSRRDFLASSTPAITQSVEWKPLDTTQVTLGLRQQKSDDWIGESQQKSNALFADFSHQLAPALTWHTNAEYERSKGQLLETQAPVATGPGSQVSQAGTASAPVASSSTTQDESMALTVGPSFQLQQDLSANLEFSNRWDKQLGANGTTDEQRVSLSLKGSF